MKKLTRNLIGGLVCLGLAVLFSCDSSSDPKVTLTEDVETYTMDNGIVKVRISKVTGDLVSFRYKDKEMFATRLDPEFVPESHGGEPADNPNWERPEITGRGHGYWSHDVMGLRGSAPAVPSITINPAKNGGKMAEVSMKASAKGGRKMGTGPGTGAEGDLSVDIEIRYTLERGASGVYTYSVFEHPADYPLAIFGEARYCAKLAPFFDWMSVDKNVDFHYPKGYNAGDKYVYTANQTQNPAFGWSSTTENVGLFFINPSMEYMSGGPTKVEFLGHRDTNTEAAPCVLNYWRSSHYGGAEDNIAAGEEWSKIIGPFMIYANEGAGPEEIYADARARAEAEKGKWPYAWVKGVDYATAKERATVKGKLVLDDPYTSSDFTNLSVGLTAGEYVSPRQNANQQIMTGWQRDGKFYQFWSKGNADGTFAIPNVPAGKYTFYAFSDGVMGEFSKADIVVEKGKSLDLGSLTWTPVRKGKQLWDIGVANRNASEFFMGDKFRDPEIALKYAIEFPDDITYTIGQSDFKKDWFFLHVPHNQDPGAVSSPFYGVRSEGRATPYKVVFNMPSAGKGKATLRFAIAGTAARSVDVNVNGTDVEGLRGLPGDGIVSRHGSQGIWYEREVVFDGALMTAGSNTLTLTVPGGPVNNGMMYDYIRLELDENSSVN